MAGADRCEHQRVQLGLDLQLVALAARHRDTQRRGHTQRQFGLCAFPGADGGHRRVDRDGRDGFRKAEAVIDQRQAALGARGFAVHADHHRNKATAVANRRRGQAVAGRFGMPGLEAVHTRIAPQQQVAVGLLDVVEDEFLFLEQRVTIREITNQRTAEPGHVMRAGVQLRVRQAGGVDEMRLRQAQLLRVTIHQIGEHVLGSRHVFRQHDAGVVAGLDDDAVQERFQRNVLADFHE